jgi:hypothetical protein
MTPESRNSSMLDNDSPGTFPRQRIDLWEKQTIYTELTHVPVLTDKQQTFSMETGDYISGRAGQNGWILHSSFVREFSSSVELSVRLCSVTSGACLRQSLSVSCFNSL